MASILKNPIFGALIAFVGVVSFTFVGVFLFYLWLTWDVDCTRVPHDPCDGPALLLAGLVTIVVPTGLFIGVVAALIAGFALAAKKEKLR